jgi:cold shock CspA family protein
MDFRPLAETQRRQLIGTEVTVVVEEGEKGPQASIVRPVGRHHHL